MLLVCATKPGGPTLLRILKTVFNAAGEGVAQTSLPILFDDQDHAAGFMRLYLAVAFRSGKSGYHDLGSYWWGCDERSTLEVHLYTIEVMGDPEGRRLDQPLYR
jgi:hypothetical protein